jgi:hypothetical protein
MYTILHILWERSQKSPYLDNIEFLKVIRTNQDYKKILLC